MKTISSSSERILACNSNRVFFEFIPIHDIDEKRVSETFQDYAARIIKKYSFFGVKIKEESSVTYWNEPDDQPAEEA